ncbi:MAG: DUF3566 domain-containing protein [Acidimicrobiales bacterium]
MSELPEPDDTMFLLATGEELVLPGDDDAAEFVSDNGASPRRRPLRPPRPSFRDRRAAKRLRARKVRRLVRHIEPWSVLKISLIFYFCLWVIMLIAGVILWNLAVSSGLIDNAENFIEELFALESFQFNGDQIFRASAVGGLVLVVAGSGFTVLMAVLFNLISDITGGMRCTVVEEETARPRPRRTRPRRGVRPTAPVGPVLGAVPDKLTAPPPESLRSPPAELTEPAALAESEPKVATTPPDR